MNYTKNQSIPKGIKGLHFKSSKHWKYTECHHEYHTSKHAQHTNNDWIKCSRTLLYDIEPIISKESTYQHKNTCNLQILNKVFLKSSKESLGNSNSFSTFKLHGCIILCSYSCSSSKYRDGAYGTKYVEPCEISSFADSKH